MRRTRCGAVAIGPGSCSCERAGSCVEVGRALRRTALSVATYAERKAVRQSELERALERFIHVCRARPDVRAIFVFGSLAARRVGPRSDLDLLVVRETAVVGIERGSDLAIAADVGLPLDLIVVTPRSVYAA